MARTLVNMGFHDIINQLESNQEVFDNLLKNKTDYHYNWRPKPEKWNLLEIVCHLLDEEILDFRARVKHALEYHENELVPIDPEGWVKTHNYKSKDYHQTLKLFLKERTNSIVWLNQLKDVDWDSSLSHPHLGNLSAELFLRNWLAHDYLHIRQILRYNHSLLKLSSKIELNYAGDW
ncbi:DinB family protein [Hyunsoonleella flava]|uniref:DinB family protein n=1 Tax=Hyunsoonleella flava TaxID=2527939 RepID=A0A4V2J9Y3_9FLAO|nr:DinB family protein [Hyunsoonleella flava]TBN01885.1 DinB family protein [Hyunsoonleella flava]